MLWVPLCFAQAAQRALATSHPLREADWIPPPLWNRFQALWFLHLLLIPSLKISVDQHSSRLFTYAAANFQPLMNPAMILAGNIKVLYFIPNLFCLWQILAEIFFFFLFYSILPWFLIWQTCLPPSFSHVSHFSSFMLITRTNSHNTFTCSWTLQTHPLCK